MKKTKIVCTMGPQENDIDLLSRMIEAGMDVARFNFSHGTHEEQAERMESVRKARERTGRPIAMLLDTKGPEIRTGLLVDHKKAFEWYESAAKDDYPAAEYNLGVCYLEGSGVEPNSMLAADCIQRAANRGFEPAKEMAKKLGIKLIDLKK